MSMSIDITACDHEGEVRLVGGQRDHLIGSYLQYYAVSFGQC